jgi:AraC-like DNA-binding protein/effector-binding domain-containing protein
MRTQELLHLLHGLRRRLDGNLTLADIARRAGKSRFQVHRDFSRLVGETPREFVERLRLEQAAARLIGSSESVFEIALGAGFSSHEVFTRAFRRKFGCTPIRYRTTALPQAAAATRAKHLMLTTQIGPCVRLFHLPLHPSTRKSPMPTISVTRQEFAGQAILLIRRSIPRSGLQGMLSECFGKLFAHGAKAGLPIAGWPVARYLSVGPGLWTVEAAMPLAAPASGVGEMESGTLPAGPVALGIHAGVYDQLPETYAAIEKWMAENGVRVGGAPWESYVTDPAQHPDPADWRTEVYWPLEK